MKNTKFMKWLSLGLILVMMAAFVGCKDADNSSTPASSAVDADSAVDAEQRNIEESEAPSTDETKELIQTYFDWSGLFYCEVDLFLESLNLVDDLQFDENPIIFDDNEYWKSNIKYSDYTQKLLSIMSKKHFEESLFSNKAILIEKDGYLCSIPAGSSGYGYDVLEVELKNTDGKKHTFVATCHYFEALYVGRTYKEVVVIKEDGKYVIDSVENIEVAQTAFKGYDTLNIDIAKVIINNYYKLAEYYYSSTEAFLNFFDLVDKVELDEKTTITVKRKSDNSDIKLYKTNVKYKDFKNQLLKYVSESFCKKHFLAEDEFAEKDGYLYTCQNEFGGLLVDTEEIELVKQNNGKYEYVIYCIDRTYEDAVSEFEVKATIIKQNGIYVIADIEKIEE